jgi:hypothetical protein
MYHILIMLKYGIMVIVYQSWCIDELPPHAWYLISELCVSNTKVIALTNINSWYYNAWYKIQRWCIETSESAVSYTTRYNTTNLCLSIHCIFALTDEHCETCRRPRSSQSSHMCNSPTRTGGIQLLCPRQTNVSLERWLLQMAWTSIPVTVLPPICSLQFLCIHFLRPIQNNERRKQRARIQFGRHHKSTTCLFISFNFASNSFASCWCQHILLLRIEA